MIVSENFYNNFSYMRITLNHRLTREFSLYALVDH